MSDDSATFFFIGFVVIQFGIFLSFYRRPLGRRAVYAAPYAWMIDALAIMSGTIIMWASISGIRNPSVFAIDPPLALLVTLFIFGSWQACIHAAKWLVRLTSRA